MVVIHIGQSDICEAWQLPPNMLSLTLTVHLDCQNHVLGHRCPVHSLIVVSGTTGIHDNSNSSRNVCSCWMTSHLKTMHRCIQSVMCQNFTKNRGTIPSCAIGNAHSIMERLWTFHSLCGLTIQPCAIVQCWNIVGLTAVIRGGDSGKRCVRCNTGEIQKGECDFCDQGKQCLHHWYGDLQHCQPWH